MSAEEHDSEILRTGAMPEDWHEINDPGYVPGGAGKLADSILAEGMQPSDETPRFYRTEEIRRANARRGRGLPQGYGDRDARDGYDARTGS
jgi:hypothetical protein